jgi:Ecdysteroid kinase-like family
MPSIPAQIADISTDWLNEVLPSNVGRVKGFEVTRFGTGVGILGELARLALDYVDGPGSGPATIVAKCQSPAPENQFLAQAMGFYLREVNFYKDVATRLNVRVPHPYYAEAGPDGLPFIILIEEITEAHCPDQITGLTLNEAERILETVARLHAAFWETQELYELAWLPPMNNPLYKAGKAMAEAQWPHFKEHFGDRIDGGMLDALHKACDKYPDMLDWWVQQGHQTFTHTDCRAENYLFGGSAGSDAITMIDFQLSTRHVGAWDVCNLLAASLTPEMRRQHEEHLISHYFDKVSEFAADQPGFRGFTLDRLWYDYRAALLQQGVAQVITSNLQGGNERGDELLEELHMRPIIAGMDHNVGDILKDM